MRKLLLVCAAVGALALSGCVGNGTNLPIGTTPSANDISGVITRVQEATKTACSFVPTAQTVAGIAAALGYGQAVGWTDIAAQICGAVTRPSAGRGSRPTVAGVKVRGTFVR